MSSYLAKNHIIFDRKLLKIKRARFTSILSKADFIIKRSFLDILEKVNELGNSFKDCLFIGITSKEQIATINNFSNIQNSCFHSSYCSNLTDFSVDEELIELALEKYDLVVSILNLHNINDLPGFLIKVRRSLKKNGIFIASLFGEDNLSELRDSLLNTEMSIFQGMSPRTMPVISIKQLGSLLQRAGYNSPIIDRDRIEVHYSHPRELISDLRNMGETNILLNRSKRYLKKEFWDQFFKYYQDHYSIYSHIIANFEVLTLTVYK